MEAEAVEEKLIYMCVGCNQALDEETVNSNSHVCPVVENEGEEEANDQEGITFYEQVSAVDVIGEADPPEEWSNSTATKAVGKGRRGDWSHTDVWRLISIYMKNLKCLPGTSTGNQSHYFWDRVMRDLRQYGDFSRYLVQAKLKKMKKTCLAILESNSETKWPYFEEMCQVLRVEQEQEAIADVQFDEKEGAESEGEAATDEPEVSGLRRWSIRETRHLIEVYKRHLPQFFTSGVRRKITWNEILADLDYDLAKRFTMYQIRAKIRNVMATYRSIALKKRKKRSTMWPLFKDVADLEALEKKLANLHGVTPLIYTDHDDDVVASITMETEKEEESADKKDKAIRWNVEETKELFEAYRERIYDICLFPTGAKNEDLWNGIANQVNEVRRLKIKGEHAKARISALRNAYLRGNHKLLTPLYNEAKEVFDAEISFKDDKADELPDVVEPTPKKKVKVSYVAPVPLEEEEEVPIPVSSCKDTDLPSWYLQYSKDAKRRHEEKIAIQNKIVDRLGEIINKYTSA